MLEQSLHYPDLAARVLSQQELQPALYGEIDFTAKPYRLSDGPDDESSLPAWVAKRAPLLADERVVELMSTATMLGDVVADPYASLMAERSFKGLIDMLKQACREGVEAVPDAPPELEAFIAAMEHQPDWLDMDLVRDGARVERIPMAFLAPFVTRGAFVATFLNTYAALPMALTGTLGGSKAARRVNETTSFFTVTTLPNALDRYGPGFEAAAMVRLMHSMVRYNALKRSDRWDLDVFGIPIPQLDQMPAGLINIYLLAAQAKRKGRSEFTDQERAVVEFCRYRCYLLGLPEELLPKTPDETLHLMHARAALLRDGFDDATCGELVRATMAAYLRADDTPFDRVAESVEKSYSKAFFIRSFTRNDTEKAAAMGVSFGKADVARIAVTAPFVIGRFVAVTAASRVPVLRDVVDSYAIRMLKKRLATYGNAEFTTDASTYTPVARPLANTA
ncbi:oxygenase MpaB family protein [Svornostia abyssi]|uniref:Oxygenase MpaB family protein n=1 Tax=Svornostia abyssi TaxID=2898438 RepID=A0ABY5PB97_9ACTN|nr:oxygenase MpaB family protein [Parviterribacteraceae bacterium J379]